MKKKKTIIIKAPQLQKIRNNLRLILIKWGQKQWFQLHREYQKIRFDENSILRDLDSNEREQVRKLRSQMAKIDHTVDHSICKCTVCSASDKDMTYNPEQKRWFCVDCYQQLQADYKGKEESILFP